MDRRIVRYTAVAAIVLVVGGLFAVRELGGESPAEPLGVAAESSRPAVGEPAPDFTLEAARTGDRVHLSDYRGQPVVLNFWATWCPPCRAEMPDLQAAYEEDSVVVLAVNAQEVNSTVSAFLDEFGLTFPTVLDRDGSVREHYGVQGLPATFFIDADGVIRARNFGPVYGNLLSDGIEAVR